MQEKPPAAKGVIRDNLEAVLLAVVLITFFKTFVAQQFTIPSGPMRNSRPEERPGRRAALPPADPLGADRNVAEVNHAS